MMKDLMKHHEKLFFAFLIFNLLVPLANIAFAYSIKLIIDTGMSQNRASFGVAIIVGVGVVFTYAILNFISFRLRNRLMKRIMSNYTNRVFQMILDKDYRDFSSENSGKFISILTKHMNKIENDYLFQIFNISRNLALMLFSLLTMFVGNWLLTLFVIVASIIPMLISGIFGKKSAILQKNMLISEQKYLAKVKDILLGFLVIKSFNVKEVVAKNFVEERNKVTQIQFRKSKFDVLNRVISELSGMLVFLVAFGGGMFLVFNGQTTIGSVTAIVQLVNFIVMPLNEVGMGMSKFREGEATLAAIKLSNTENRFGGVFKKQFEKRLAFSNVTFAYPHSEDEIFSDLSLSIQKGEKVAIVGMSGSGKTTLLNLLLRFYEPATGKIFVDNNKLSDLSVESIYNLMTVVQQDVYVFDDTLRANITLNQKFTEAEINKAIKLSGLSDFVLESSQGLETVCGENGGNLSGGQKQRLCIARALIRKTPILLLDEATSSLDNQVTSEVENSILDIDNLTVIIVTHKLNENLLKKYNRILFMKNGKIIEDGNFEELLEREGEFYNLFRLNL